MKSLLYEELVGWYRLVDPPEEHEAEAATYLAAFTRAASSPPATLLELGSGAGHNALYLKASLACTLSDISEPMLSLSRALNPECEHVLGDMRTLRLGRTFDAVLIHDAIAYMTTEADLARAIDTAFVHTRPGGAAVFAPDCTRETFLERTDLLENDRDGRSMRGLDWSWDPDPSDTTYLVEYAFLFREPSGVVTAAHDRHLEGLFSRDVWIATLEGAGYRVETERREVDPGYTDEIFVCRRP